MTKKELLKKIVSVSVLNGLAIAYEMDVSSLSEKQEKLIEVVSDDLYNNIGNKLSLKDLHELYRRLHETADSL